MAGRKKLTRYVNVGGVAYAPGDDLPAEIAEQITNPKAFADPEVAAEGAGDEPEPEATRTPAARSRTAPKE